MTAVRLPLSAYGTLLPGEPDHDRFLRGRTRAERPIVLPGALLCEGPGHRHAIGGHGTVHGALVTAAPGAYAELLGPWTTWSSTWGPDHPRNPYERVVRRAVPAPLPDASGSARSGSAEPVRAEPVRAEPVCAWVLHLAGAAVARSLRTGGTPVPGGDRLSLPPPPVRRTP